MDIQEDLKEIFSINSENTKSIIEQSIEYKENLEKRFHILNVVNIAHLINKLEENKIFEKCNVRYIQFRPGEIFCSYDKNKNFLWGSTDKKIEQLNKAVEDLFKGTLNQKYLESGTATVVDLSKPIKEQVFKILLSKDLIKIIDYNEMQMELPYNNSQEEVKKLKI